MGCTHSYQHSENNVLYSYQKYVFNNALNTYFSTQNYALLYDKTMHSLLLYAICFKILINNLNQ